MRGPTGGGAIAGLAVGAADFATRGVRGDTDRHGQTRTNTDRHERTRMNNGWTQMEKDGDERRRTEVDEVDEVDGVDGVDGHGQTNTDGHERTRMNTDGHRWKTDGNGRRRALLVLPHGAGGFAGAACWGRLRVGWSWAKSTAAARASGPSSWRPPGKSSS